MYIADGSQAFCGYSSWIMSQEGYPIRSHIAAIIRRNLSWVQSVGCDSYYPRYELTLADDLDPLLLHIITVYRPVSQIYIHPLLYLLLLHLLLALCSCCCNSDNNNNTLISVLLTTTTASPIGHYRSKSSVSTQSSSIKTTA